MNFYSQKFQEICEYFIDDLKSRSTIKENSFICIEKIFIQKASQEDLQAVSEFYYSITKDNSTVMFKKLAEEYSIFKN